MYLDYFGLNRFPFSIAPDPDLLYLSPAHHEALAHLNYALTNHGGLICLTGEVGMGKTTLCRAFIDQVPKQVDVAYIFNPMLSAHELLQSICHELEIPVVTKDGESLVSNKELIDRLYESLIKRYSQGRKVICIIDEAQSMPAPLLEQIRLLTNLETNRDKLLTLILVGQPELQDILARHEVRQLDQRITARYHLSAMSPKELQPYLRHRLKVAGCDFNLFTSESAAIIWQASNGIPRLINSIADRALLGVYATNAKNVNKSIARQAVSEVIGVKKRRKETEHTKAFGKWAFSLAFIFLITWLAFTQQEKILMLFKQDNHFQLLAQAYGLNKEQDLSGCLEISQLSDLSCLSISWPLKDLKKLTRPLAVFDGVSWKIVTPESLIISPQQVVVLRLKSRTLIQSIRPGEVNPIIPWVREQLMEEGDVQWQIIAPKGQEETNTDQFYDPLLADKVARFQKRIGLVSDKIIGMKTLLVMQDLASSLKSSSSIKEGVQ